MMGLALKWSPDAQPARLESVLTTETTGKDGKSTVWRGYFASPNRRSTKTIVPICIEVVAGCPTGKAGIRSDHRNDGQGRKVNRLARILCLAQSPLHQDHRLLRKPPAGCTAVRSFRRRK